MFVVKPKFRVFIDDGFLKVVWFWRMWFPLRFYALDFARVKSVFLEIFQHSFN